MVLESFQCENGVVSPPPSPAKRNRNTPQQQQQLGFFKSPEATPKASHGVSTSYSISQKLAGALEDMVLDATRPMESVFNKAAQDAVVELRMLRCELVELKELHETIVEDTQNVHQSILAVKESVIQNLEQAKLDAEQCRSLQLEQVQGHRVTKLEVDKVRQVALTQVTTLEKIDESVKGVSEHIMVMREENTTLNREVTLLKGLQAQTVNELKRLRVEVVKSKEQASTKYDQLEHQLALQSLGWAMDHACIGAFEYSTGTGETVKSTALVVAVLMSFRRGVGHFLPNPDSVANYSEFVDKLVKQLHGLTGVKPRVSENGAMTVIFYS